MVADLRLVAEADRPDAGRDIEAGAKVQRTAFDEPKTKPQPPDTLQISVPIWTPPCACAGPPPAKMPLAKASDAIAEPSLSYMLSPVMWSWSDVPL